MKFYKVKEVIESIYMATNPKHYRSAHIKVMNKLNDMCANGEITYAVMRKAYNYNDEYYILHM